MADYDLTSVHGNLVGLTRDGHLAVGGLRFLNAYKQVGMGKLLMSTALAANNAYTFPEVGGNGYVHIDAGGVAGGATKTLVPDNSGTIVKLDTAAGTVVTLPAATGSGAKFKFIVTVLATSNSHKIQVANASDFFVGIIDTVNGSTVTGWIAANSGTVATNSDTITLNRSTTGSVSVGEWIEVEDVAANTWAVKGHTSASGTTATPFTAAV